MNSKSVDYTGAKTGVFWDVEDCPVPDGLSAADATNNIKNALKFAGFNGEVSIIAFGHTRKYLAGIKRNNHTTLKQFRAGDRRARRRAICDSLFEWTILVNERKLTNLMIIIGDTTVNTALVDYLHDLVGFGFNLLVSQSPANRSIPLHPSVFTEWLWPDLGLGKEPIYKWGDPVLGNEDYLTLPPAEVPENVDTDHNVEVTDPVDIYHNVEITDPEPSCTRD
ncbi:uncharacterized protein LOC111830723 [Capsella rubella]|uniref:uncharacterized protein LOC111830723 n=1 Tax=Capsella rubella TaxID=81985 RepID=UPI000CD5295B|nr:uncharacterized protein LOC111830723 [Capsella rubella]